ncbi:hypothetical protein NDU88_006301 [Pleurodeles waltl]|uniref:Uncharacterized protein n=1 Tax=Pleurodeles waltl TaxID=8319 RepID=A0AAV7SP75_PLEWA|nr:hypothetical protein NDU88_006301 [Pleurodeles waltl]
MAPVAILRARRSQPPYIINVAAFFFSQKADSAAWSADRRLRSEATYPAEPRRPRRSLKADTDVSAQRWCEPVPTQAADRRERSLRSQETTRLPQAYPPAGPREKFHNRSTPGETP